MKTGLPSRIFLVGFMGCGKTTVGKRLANLIHYEFIDLDHQIEQAEGCAVSELFSIKGETYFRQLEKQALHQTFKKQQTVIATGGGAPAFFDNMEQMNQQGITIYLELSPKTLLERLQNAKNQRPLLMDKNEKDLFDYITQTLQKRESHYRQAKLIIDGLGVTAQLLMNAMELYQSHQSDYKT